MKLVKMTRRKSKTTGLPPGSVVYVGKKEIPLQVDAVDYTADEFWEKRLEDLEECFPFKATPSISWINFTGLNNTDEIIKLGKHYDWHHLLMEDIANTRQRPKLDEYENYLFCVFKMLYYNREGELTIEHLSLVLGSNYVVTFQEEEEDVFDDIRDRLRHAKGRIRGASADYLFYALMDSVVDYYFVVLEELGERIERLENEVYGEVTDDTVRKIQELKREAVKIRRSIYPVREVLNKIEKTQHFLIEGQTMTYFRDLYDHTIQVIETIETYRDTISGLMDAYMSNVSNKMNQVMKVLTIIATIFIPLTFIAGIYGMNFEYIPELQWKYSYFVLWGIMIVVFLAMLYYFKRKKWL
ncbi:magnesium/cobalt transporter CorA [Croceiramulus getboli]|nr:magnesium/cobalt transporter CorA [Flavobacteriaceae bacterium YJPT1-3]